MVVLSNYGCNDDDDSVLVPVRLWLTTMLIEETRRYRDLWNGKLYDYSSFCNAHNQFIDRSFELSIYKNDGIRNPRRSEVKHASICLSQLTDAEKRTSVEKFIDLIWILVSVSFEFALLSECS